VTAVSFTPDDRYVVYASGPNVIAYSVDEDKNVCKRPIFERNRVHGIQCILCIATILIVVDRLPEDFAILLWGATSFAYSLSVSAFLSPNWKAPMREVKMDDWILDSRFLNENTILLVTAHNSLLIYDTTTGNVSGQFKCEEQSLLYAAQLFLTTNSEREVSDAIVASGTVFNEIQLWRPPTIHDNASSVIPISRRLKGHEGCIFSLRFSDDGTLLASCSDDRTIRIWDVESGTQLAIGFSHIARVWDVRFVPGSVESAENLYLLSSSEDTTAILWCYSKSSRKLKVQERYQGHRGKHVWSQAVSSDGTKAVTGGNDGGVNIWDITGWRDCLESAGNDLYWTELTPSVLVNGKEKRDTIKGYRCLYGDRLLITTGSGYLPWSSLLMKSCVYIYSLSRRTWTLVLQDETYRNYGAAASIQGLVDWVCLGNSRGGARLFNLTQRDEVCSRLKHCLFLGN